MFCVFGFGAGGRGFVAAIKRVGGSGVLQFVLGAAL
jgi:hypothetical protein